MSFDPNIERKQPTMEDEKFYYWEKFEKILPDSVRTSSFEAIMDAIKEDVFRRREQYFLI